MKLMHSVLIILLVLFSSCGGNKKNNMASFDAMVWTDDATTYDSTSFDDKTVAIPYVERGGVKYIPVRINGGDEVEMIVDTGCSAVLISIGEAQCLYDSGLLSDSDYVGSSFSSIADGSIVEDMVFNIDKIVIGNEITCSNIKVSVSKSITAPLLLGNGVFDGFSSITIDNTNKLIIFHL